MGKTEDFNCLLYLNGLEIGAYWLKLGVPSSQNLTIPFTVISQDMTLSMNQKLVDAYDPLTAKDLTTFTTATRIEVLDDKNYKEILNEH